MTTTAGEPGALPAHVRMRLGDALLALGLVRSGELDLALHTQATDGGGRRLGQVMVDLGLVTVDELAQALARAHGLPLLPLDTLPIDNDVARSVPRQLSERRSIIAYDTQAGRVLVAVADPVDVVALDDVRTVLGATSLEVGVATPEQIRAALDAAWTHGDDSEVVRDFRAEFGDADEEVDLERAEDAATVRLVDRVMALADRMRASDVHVEPQRDVVRIRMRVDGVLRDVMELPRAGYGALVARLKIVAELDVIERRVPQDGRARVRVEGRRLDVRVSTLPALHGEKIVLRLLPKPTDLPRLAMLGIPPEQCATLLAAVARPQGLILLTGPTGSGKTNTQYAAIAEGVDSDRNVVTLEDPVEIEIPGTTQVHVDERAGLGFARGLRAILRQDPDVILVGEIRDQETAQLAVRASVTGHLVLSTLHTLDAASAITRLVDMGVPPYLVIASLSLVASQRLVRIPCPDCAEREQPDADLLHELGVDDPAGLWLRATGCPRCNGTGYQGRTAVMELLEIGPDVRHALLAGGDEDDVRRIARSTGTRSLFEQGVELAREGRTTLAEVIRAVPRDPAP